MKNYERITPKDLIETLNMPQGDDMTRFLLYARRLWELENAIEQGKLADATPAGTTAGGGMTNREFLNSLSDEQFAATLRCGFLCYRCANGTGHGTCKIKAISTKPCYDGIAAWLKQKYDGSALLTPETVRRDLKNHAKREREAD